MKAVVFGGAGFLGSHVADALSDKEYEVLIYDWVATPYLRDNQKMMVADILDQEKINEAVAGVDYVYHFAGIADIKQANINPVDTVKYNILSTAYILDACINNSIKRFLYASTVYVYSQQGGFYRGSKQAAEILIENYNKIYGLKYTILRYGSLYGKRANNFNFINNVIKQAITEGKIERKGDGNEIRDYINVLDAARSSVEILVEEFENKFIMITGAQTFKVKDVLNMINEMLNNEILIQYSNEKIEDHYEITPYNFKPKVALKYVPKYYHDLGQGILDSIYDVSEQFSKTSKEQTKLHLE